MHQTTSVHLATGMTKVIYCSETNLFRDQSQLTASERRNVTELGSFGSHINMRACIVGLVASNTPVNDLQLNKQIMQWRIAGEL